jgi:hypothetical protein
VAGELLGFTEIFSLIFECCHEFKPKPAMIVPASDLVQHSRSICRSRFEVIAFVVCKTHSLCIKNVLEDGEHFHAIGLSCGRNERAFASVGGSSEIDDGTGEQHPSTPRNRNA